MSRDLFDLSGRTALITGSSRGLGRAMAEGLATAGARVVLNGLDAARLSASAEAFTRAGHQVLTAAFDVTDEAAVTRAFDDFDALGTEIDILVNNAGIQLRKPLVDLSLDEWNKVLATNLTSAFVVGREAARRMMVRQRGKIINIGSLNSELARPTIAPYSTAKGGIRMLTRAMAAEWGRFGIQANAIGPGYMLTDMNTPLAEDPKFDAWVKSRTPAGRWGKPEELIGAAVFLAGRASDYVNGQIIYVDGGMLAVV